jgi:outer membrane protein
MVRDAYYGALLAEAMMAVAQARQEAASEMVRVARAEFEAGRGIEATVRRAEAEAADARRMLTLTENDRAKLLLELKRAMGMPADAAEVSLSDTLTFAAPDYTIEASLVEASKTRPELAAARARAAAARAQAGVAEGSRRPQVYGAVMGDVFSSREMGQGGGATVGVTISLPLFDAGQRRAEADAARAMADAEDARVRDTELRITTEVRQAWLDVETAARNYATAQAALEAARAAYEVVELRVRSGRAILIEQLDALAARTQAQANVAQALYDHAAAVARLRRAVGRP